MKTQRKGDMTLSLQNDTSSDHKRENYRSTLTIQCGPKSKPLPNYQQIVLKEIVLKSA